MRRTITSFIILCLTAITLQAQSDTGTVLDDRLQCGPPDYIIMINGKLPCSVHTIITFDPAIYKDSIRYDFYYNFKRYSYGSVNWSEKCPDLCSIIPDTAKVYLEYCFREPVGWNQLKDHLYHDTLQWDTFYGIEFVNITKINKKHYYINYILQPPLKMWPIYDKEKYGKTRRAYKKFYKKITRGWFPYGYDIPDRPTGKSHPVYF